MTVSWAAWSRYDPPSLARHVTPEAARYVRLPHERLSLERQPDGRRRLARALYEALAGRGIRYDLEPYDPRQPLQRVRTPAEVMDRPGVGSCLDLTALYCGVCLGYELLAIIVVMEGHALAAVSLTHGLRDWDALPRRERSLFELGPLTDLASMKSLVDSQAYLMVECTGFAISSTLPATAPEGRGRVDGLLSFDRAAAAGSEQLEARGGDFRFAIDLATAWYGWRVEPRRFSGHGEIALDEGKALKVTAEGVVTVPATGPPPRVTPVPLPLTPALRPEPDFVDRERAVDAAREAALAGTPLQFYAGAGWGKTTLLRRLAYDDVVDRFPDGAVFLQAADKDAADLLHELFTSFYDTDQPYRPGRAELGRRLRDRRALVLVDDMGLEPDQMQVLLDTVPSSAFVVTAGRLAWGQGTALAVGGLPPEHALDLVQRKVSHPLTERERKAVQEVARTLDGHPGGLFLAAALLQMGPERPGELLSRVLDRARAGRDLSQALVSRLPSDQRAVVGLLAALAVPVGMEHVQALVEKDAGREAVRALEKRGLVTGGPLSCQLLGPFGDALGGDPGAERWLARALDHFVAWAGRNAGDADRILADAPAMSRLAAWAHENGREREALTLARTLDGPLALAGRWSRRRLLLELAAAAAAAIAATANATAASQGSGRPAAPSKSVWSSLASSAWTGVRTLLGLAVAAGIAVRLGLIHIPPSVENQFFSMTGIPTPRPFATAGLGAPPPPGGDAGLAAAEAYVRSQRPYRDGMPLQFIDVSRDWRPGAPFHVLHARYREQDGSTWDDFYVFERGTAVYHDVETNVVANGWSDDRTFFLTIDVPPDLGGRGSEYFHWDGTRVVRTTGR